MHRTPLRAFTGAAALVALTLATPAGAASATTPDARPQHPSLGRLDQGTRVLGGVQERRNAAKWPKDCIAIGAATDATGHIGAAGIAGRPLAVGWIDEKSLIDFKPVALGELPLSGSSEESYYLATDAKGRLLAVEGAWKAQPGQAVKIVVVQESGWGDVTKIVAGFERPGGAFTFYADRGKGTIERWSATVGQGSAWSVALLSSMTAPDFSSAQFVAPAYPLGGKNSLSDVFVGVSKGRLMEWRMRHSRPRTMTATVLQKRGWSNDAKVVTGSCFDKKHKPTKQRPMLSFLPNGRVHGYLEANGHDGKGNDITTLGMLGRGIDAKVWPAALF